MAIKRAAIAAVALLLLVGLPSIALAANLTIQGNLTADLQNGRPLGNNATLYVRLDNLTTGVPITQFVSQGVVSGKQQPYGYSLTVVDTQITAGNQYRVVAEIVDGNQNRLYRGVSNSFTVAGTGTTNAPLFQAGPSFGRLGDPSSGTWRIALALLLVAMAGAIALWRRSRALQLVRRPA
jgi:hypothetical protein